METPLLAKRDPGEPRLGEKASYRRTLTEADVALFIGVTRDVNPLHMDDKYAAGMHFKRRIIPELWDALSYLLTPRQRQAEELAEAARLRKEKP